MRVRNTFSTRQLWKLLMRNFKLKLTAPGTARQTLPTESGFTLLELMIVIAIILIMASFAAPIYSRIVTRSHEAVLKDDLFTMRQMISRFTLDNHRPPESLEELVKSGYLSGGLPIDPFTGSNQTWQADIKDVSVRKPRRVAEQLRATWLKVFVWDAKRETPARELLDKSRLV